MTAAATGASPGPARTKVCILGAGSSGVTVAKALAEAGVPFDIFEKGSDIGGMWRYENDNGQSSCYASLHIDTSRPNLGYPDFPIREGLPDFLSHAQFLEHLEAYADHFGIRERVTFNTEVTALIPEADGVLARLSSGEEKRYSHAVIANGHLSAPRMPDFPGTFDGPAIHSHHYRTNAPYDGRRVLVVGLGNSAVDIAADISRVAEHVDISTRRSAWILPKYLFGRPADQVSGLLARRLRLPTPWVRRIMAVLARIAQGDQARFGVPRPAHPMHREHATLSSDLLPAIGHGRIAMKPNVAALRGRRVAFADGSEAAYDAIVYATGYRTEFPFLGREAFDPDRDLDALYRRMVSLSHPRLVFAGLVQPIGPTIPLVEIQGRWIAAWLSGAMALPAPGAMRREAEAHAAARRAQWLDAPRYALEVDFREIAGKMRADMKAGAAGA